MSTYLSGGPEDFPRLFHEDVSPTSYIILIKHIQKMFKHMCIDFGKINI